MRSRTPGGGSSIGGNRTSGPRYTCASSCSSSGAPPSSIAAVPWTTRYSLSPGGWIRVPSNETTTRGSRRTLRSLRCRGFRCAVRRSSPSTATHTQVTCGAPSGLLVTRCPSAPDRMSSLALSDSGTAGESTTVRSAPDGGGGCSGRDRRAARQRGGQARAQEERRVGLRELPRTHRRRPGAQRERRAVAERLPAPAAVAVGGQQVGQAGADEVLAGQAGLLAVLAQQRADADLQDRAAHEFRPQGVKAR